MRMRAMALTGRAAGLLQSVNVERPEAGPGELVVRVSACGVCRTDLHVVDGDLPDPAIPIIPGHEIVGRVEQVGAGADSFAIGDRVGIPWLGWSCGTCEFCRRGDENLCRQAHYTGYQIDGGYAEYARANARFCFRLPLRYDDCHAAPLLCAGLIGYRAYKMTRGKRLGVYGFGAAAHIIAQLAIRNGQEIYAFVAPGDDKAEAFALELGVTWVGASNQAPPESLDSAIVFAPVGSLVPEALSRTTPGGVVVCAGIHMSDLPTFPYRLLWEERVIRSVANLTRADAQEFLMLAADFPIETHVHTYRLADANRALAALRAGRLSGAAVLIPNASE